MAWYICQILFVPNLKPTRVYQEQIANEASGPASICPEEGPMMQPLHARPSLPPSSKSVTFHDGVSGPSRPWVPKAKQCPDVIFREWLDFGQRIIIDDVTLIVSRITRRVNLETNFNWIMRNSLNSFGVLLNRLFPKNENEQAPTLILVFHF